DVNGTSSSCDFNLIVVDVIGPVAICETGVEVTLTPSGNAIIFPETIDDGSYDNCGIFSLELSQTEFTCDDVGDSVVVFLVILDNSGNFNSCAVEVIVNSFPNPTNALACNDLVFVSLDNNGMAEITSDMVLEGGPYKCPSEYAVNLDLNGVTIPNATVNVSHVGETITATIIDIETGNTCWGQIFVDGRIACAGTYDICDTECNSAPVGDCNSGHTLNDGVEWPCDLDVDFCSQNFSPTELIANGINETDVYPQIFGDSCALVAFSWQDLVTQLPNGARIERTWILIDWYQFDPGTNVGIWEYTQTITALTDSLYVCDTLPWNTPVGDCASGHTLDDDVEWPSDFSVSTCNVSLDALRANPDVHPNDVEPQFDRNCDLFAVNYSDQVINGATETKVLRTWFILNWQSGDAYQYVQIITITDQDCSVEVCAYDRDGNGINNVEFHPNYTSDSSGCVTIDNANITQVTPTKDDVMDNGVDIYDYIAVRRHILGIESIQDTAGLLAADVNNNGV
ncbi:MAG: hypothetical protein AAGK97_12450, partial [Bacteroidota bacterium]